MVIDPTGRHAFITNLYGNDLAVLDLEELKVVARIPVGEKPNGVSFSTVTVNQQRAVKVVIPRLGGPDDEDAHGERH